MEIKDWYIVFLIIYPISIICFLFYAHYKSWLRLDHHNLFKQKLFWLSILIPFMTFLAFGIWSWWGHAPELTASGFDKFLTISKLPLLFLAASVPLASIVNNIHRTIQTEKQINEAQQKNYSDAYYTHFKHTLELMKGIKSEKVELLKENDYIELSFLNPISLYHTIYINNSPQNLVSYTPNENLVNTIVSNWEKINTSLKSINLLERSLHRNQGSPIKRRVGLINLYIIEDSIENIINALKIENLTPHKRPHFDTQGMTYRGLTPSHNILNKLLIELNLFCEKFLDIILPFDKKIRKKIHLKSVFYISFSYLGYNRNSWYENHNNVKLTVNDGEQQAAYEVKSRKIIQLNTAKN